MKKTIWKKIIIIAAAAVVVALFLAFDLQRFLTLAYIKESQARFSTFYSSNPVLVLSLFILAYVIITSLSLPGAGIMTLASGALFGLVVGTIAASVASTIGATIACFVSRFILRDWVQERFGAKLTTINEGIDKEGGFYLFTLRLIPIFPFFVINLVMGLTRMPLRRFAWVSQVGMLPATMVFVNAGKELSKIESASDILSPTLLVSFIILGLFPITVKRVMAIVRKRVGNTQNIEVGNDKV